MLLTLFFFWRQSNRRWSEIQFWIALFPVYFKSMILALLPGKPKYKVTAKMISKGRIHLTHILPHLLAIAINMTALYWYIFYLDYGFNLSAIIACIWVGLILVWFWPVLEKGLNISFIKFLVSRKEKKIDEDIISHSDILNSEEI